MRKRPSAAIEPEWSDEKFVTAKFGLTHMMLFNLRKAGKIRSLSSREDGKKYGKRLYNIASIRKYLEEQEARELVGTEVAK